MLTRPAPSLDALVDRAWEIHRAAANDVHLVRPSIPILYFGDLTGYARSARRVVTVGLNPSGVEFPEDDPFQRLPAARTIRADDPDESARPAYLRALDGYFAVRPYTGWFEAFERVLNGLDASYYRRHANVALHTDIGTPLATSPTWTELPAGARAGLAKDGAALWFELVDALEPDVVPISVGKAARAPVEARLAAPWALIHTVTTVSVPGMLRATPYQVFAAPMTLPSGASTLVVYGRAAQLPFGLVSRGEKESIGRKIAERLDGA